VGLDRDAVALLEGAPSMIVATCSEDLMPNLVQAVGCRVLADGRVVVIVSRVQAESVLESLEAGQRIAVTFSRPTTVRTVQLKGEAVTISPARRVDHETVRRFRAAFAIELEQVGYGGGFGEAITDTGDAELVAITFVPTAVFEQTPGPAAGRLLVDEDGGA
jgi:hypothetical protein